MVRMRVATLLLCLGLMSCSREPFGSAESVSAEQPVSQGGSTDPAYDWEKSTGLNLSRTSAPTTIQSSKTLEQTTKWLHWAMSRYGNVHPTNYSDKVGDIRVNGCTMEWTETRQQDDRGGVTPVTRYVIPLGKG